MKIQPTSIGSKLGIAPFIATLLCLISGIQQTQAELPILSDPPWLGYFAVFANKTYQFSVTSDGITNLKILNKDSDYQAIPITFQIEQIQSDGSTKLYPLKAETFESPHPATAILKESVIRGSFADDAQFELFMGQDRSVISMGGHITNSGSLDKNSLRFVIQLEIPPLYDTTNKGDWDKQKTKEFEKSVSQDHIRLKWADGKIKKQTFEHSVDAKSNDINGSGIVLLEVVTNAYGRRKLNFMTSSKTSLVLSNKQTAPLHEGFSIRWVSSPSDSTLCKDRISFTVK